MLQELGGLHPAAVYTEIVANVSKALNKLTGSKGGNVNKVQKTAADVVLEAAVSSTMSVPLVEVATALGVPRKRVDAAVKRRDAKDELNKWLVVLCDQEH